MTFPRASLRAVYDVEMVLGNLPTQHAVLGCPFDTRQNESLCELVLAEGSFGLGGQDAVDEHQSVGVAVVVLLVEAADERWRGGGETRSF